MPVSPNIVKIITKFLDTFKQTRGEQLGRGNQITAAICPRDAAGDTLLLN